MANKKISITAELVSIIKAGEDPRNFYFVSRKAKVLYAIAKKVIPTQKLIEIFEWRLALTNVFDDKIKEFIPDQIIEIGAGYSLRGFDLCLKNSNLIYFDTDLPAVIAKKKEIINLICKNENLIYPDNYKLKTFNCLSAEETEKLNNLIKKDLKTIIIAEGLTSYFSSLDYDKFLKNILSILSNLKNSIFFSNEKYKQPSGASYNLLRKFISIITNAKKRNNFKNQKEFADFLKKFGKYQIENRNNLTTYTIFANLE